MLQPSETKLCALWDDIINLSSRYKTFKISESLEHVYGMSEHKMSLFDDHNNDIYKDSVFKNIWNKEIYYAGTKEFSRDIQPQQQSLFSGYQNELPSLCFNNGLLSICDTDSSYYGGEFSIWRDRISPKGSTTFTAYDSLLKNTLESMPGMLATRLSRAVNVLITNQRPASHREILLTSSAISNESSSIEKSIMDEYDGLLPILDSGVYLVKVSDKNKITINERYDTPNKLYLNHWIYVVGYGASLKLNRHVLQSQGVMDHVHIVQYPNSTVEINTHDRGDNWRMISVESFKNTKTILNGSTLLKHDSSSNIVILNHNGENSESKINYRSAIFNDNLNAFTGMINVDKTAKNIKSIMENKNLLLDKNSKATSKPILKINTKDIECSHGCTISNIDENELYYLATLGIEHNKAKHMIASGHIKI